MKRALQHLIRLYPKSWRNRYKHEFCALLDDVSPTWRTLFDVSGGALKMQMKIWSPWKIVAIFAIAGVAASAAYSLVIPNRYVSTAVIKIGDGQRPWLARTLQQVESRAFLTTVINEGDLYKGERTRMPLEDVIEQMKSKDILISSIDKPGAIAVSFTSTDAGQAQRTAQRLAAQFVDAKVGVFLDPANLPVHARNPRRSRIVIMGLLAGILAGTLFALFNGLKVWKVAAGLGIAGAITGAAVAFVLPERFSSEAVIRYEGPDLAAAGDRVRQIVAVLNSDANLRAIILRFNLYPSESGRERRLVEHLHIEMVKNGPAIVIRFDDRNRYVAQKVVADVVGRLMEESIEINVRTGPQAGFTLELLDPPTLPLNAFFPNRPVVVGTGFLVGMAGAIMLGVWRHYKGSLPVDRLTIGPQVDNLPTT